MLLNAQSDSELLFFNSSGHVILVRGELVIKKIQGESFQKNDVLKIIGGDVTIINLNNKRITLEESGTYSFDDIYTIMQQVESSLTNRYFVYVWHKMNKDDKQTNQPGGVIRGDGFVTLPSDSIIVLTDNIKFSINNESGSDYDLIIKSNNNIIEQYPIRENLTLSILDIVDGQPGKYYWEIKVPFGSSPDKKYFIIPDDKTRNILLEEYKKTISEFSIFDKDLQTLLIDEYLSDKKLYFHTIR